MANKLSEESLLRTNGWERSGIHESFKKPNQSSHWYSAFTSVAKASYSYFKSVVPADKRTTNNIFENPCDLHFIQPIVVLNGRLFRSILTKKGEISVNEIDNAAFNFDYKSQHYDNSPFRIDIVTLNGLNTYAEQVKKRQITLCNSIKEIAENNA